MRLKFHLHCETSFGENAYLNIGNDTLLMYYTQNYCWELMIGDVDADEIGTYTYSIKKDGKLIAISQLKRIIPNVVTKSLDVFDDFIVDEADVYQSTPFNRCYYPRKAENKEVKGSLLQVYAPLVDAESVVAISGAQIFLGAWNVQNALPLNYIGNGWWQIEVNRVEQIEYKFIVINKETHHLQYWEDGNNRIDHFDGEKCQVKNHHFRHHYHWHGNGVAVPIFSLRTDNDWGIGEFLDLKRLTDWAVERNLKILQILPINDTTHTFTNNDSYPYRAISIYALHPIYINVDAIGKIDKQKRKVWEKQRLTLNAKPAVDYKATLELKMKAFRHLYEQTYEELSKNENYKTFCLKNKRWLYPYAVFCCLRDEYGTVDMTCWGNFATYTPSNIKKYMAKHQAKVEFYCFLQYHAAKQLAEAHQYANTKGIALKGDLPIGISAHSVDAWMEPELFHLDKQAGAPPDDFSINGQNWGFPTYNWPKMAQHGFLWWKNRFSMMADYFDAYRIDHILGFFRIWEIPTTSIDGVLGYFNPALPLSPQEIYYKGIRFNAHRMAEPYLREDQLQKTFGQDYQQIADTFLVRKNAELMAFKPQYATQRHMQHYIDNHPRQWSQQQRRQLLDLYTEVLFVEDTHKPGYYHPRITPFATTTFAHLSEEEKNAFRALHEDYFHVRHNQYWREEALSKLPLLLSSTDMLVCGEDLGMVPQCVPEVMKMLHILSLEVQRMPKQYGAMFVNANNTPHLSVYTTGTHDTSTFRAWWTEDKQKTQYYYNEILKHEGKAPRLCNATIMNEVLLQSLATNSMLCILPIQDVIISTLPPKKERINDPSNPHHYWCYRMHTKL